jgi:hypothetical protein
MTVRKLFFRGFTSTQRGFAATDAAKDEINRKERRDRKEMPLLRFSAFFAIFAVN